MKPLQRRESVEESHLAYRMLLADDSPTIQKVVELTFSDADYDLVCVPNGQRALEKVAESAPDLILADEPTGDLDAQSADEILAILEKLNREFKKTVVMVTHDPRAAHHATVTRHLDKGVLLPEGVTA